ncbi:hypothetical protein ACFWGM_18590, partial [Streptomyces roseolus]
MSGGPEGEWRRLDPRTLLVTAAVFCGIAVGAGVPVAAGLSGGRPLGQAVAWVLAGAPCCSPRSSSGNCVPPHRFSICDCSGIADSRC